MYLVPKTEILSLNTNSLSAELNWNVTDRSCILRFEIEVKSEGKEFQWSKPNTDNYLLIENLNPCQEYYVQLKTLDVNSELLSNNTIKDITKYAGKSFLFPPLSSFPSSLL